MPGKEGVTVQPTEKAAQAPQAVDRSKEEKAQVERERPTAPKAAAPASPRTEFIETAYWNPSVVTDSNGRARVRFRAPTALAEYRLTARG